MGVATQSAEWKVESERIPIWNSDWSEKLRDDEERHDFCEKRYSSSNFTIDKQRTLLFKKETQLNTSQIPASGIYIAVIGRTRTMGKTEDTQRLVRSNVDQCGRCGAALRVRGADAEVGNGAGDELFRFFTRR